MLSKLLKYELKATARIFMPLYIVLLSFAIVNRLISSLALHQWQTPQVISMIIYISILVGMFVITFVMMIQRFYKNLLSDEGYLMFTLPTKTWKHIISKLLVAMMWIIASGIAAVISIIIITAHMTSILPEIRNFYINHLSVLLTASNVLFALEILLFGLVILASGVLIIYASIAIGHLFNQHRIIASVGAFIVLSTVTQLLVMLLGALLSNLEIDLTYAVEPIIHFVLLSVIIFSALPALGYFLLTNFILSKHLNLE